MTYQHDRDLNHLQPLTEATSSRRARMAGALAMVPVLALP